MEKRIEDLEVSLEVAEAKADLAIRLIRYLCDELQRSQATNWGSDELFRQFLDDVDYDIADKAMELARLAVDPEGDGGSMGDGVRSATAHAKMASRLREEIRDRLKRSHSDPS